MLFRGDGENDGVEGGDGDCGAAADDVVGAGGAALPGVAIDAHSAQLARLDFVGHGGFAAQQGFHAGAIFATLFFKRLLVQLLDFRHQYYIGEHCGDGQDYQLPGQRQTKKFTHQGHNAPYGQAKGPHHLAHHFNDEQAHCGYDPDNPKIHL